MKVLITGCKGFVGSHLCTEFETNGYEVVKCDIVEETDIISLNILDQPQIQRVLNDFRPDFLINMAGQANVGLSWERPQFTMELNTIGFINIMEAVKAVDRKIRVIAIGSSDEYGSLKEIGTNVREDVLVKPITPYAISKLTQELFAQLYVNIYGMDVCMTRLFNLGGAGQTRGYMISDFSAGIAEVESGYKSFIAVGNLNSARDFTHVKDACRAVRFIVEKGRTGEIYNICSGLTYTAQEILNKLLNMAKIRIPIQVDPLKMRPSDTPVICGNHDKLTAHTGWHPEIGLDEILKDALCYWRGQFLNNEG